MKKIKLTNKTIKEIDKAVAKIIKDYGCCILASQFDDESFIEDCEKSNHKKYHDPKIGYNLELNV